MKKHPYLIILLTTIICLRGFSQALPPVVNSFTDSIGSTSLTIYLNYTANDTGVIKAQIQLQQGTGHTVYDSVYILQAPITDSGIVQLNVGPLTTCTDYQVLVDMSNDQAQGELINPLFTFTTLCVNSIELLNENTWSVIASAQSIEVKSAQISPNGMIEVYDLTGKLILSAPFNQSVQQIPFNQNAGIYLLRITGNNQPSYTTRFVTY